LSLFNLCHKPRHVKGGNIRAPGGREDNFVIRGHGCKEFNLGIQEFRNLGIKKWLF